ncbi:MAG TPA: proteasome activator, partial [Ilumatobacteraceae bacterium]
MTDEPVETPDAVMPPGVTPDVAPDGDEPVEMISEPAKVMRIGSMVKQLLDEVKAAPLDDASRDRLAGIYQRSLDEL